MNNQTQAINIAELKKVAIIGFGMTGQSVIRFLKDSTAEIIAMDTREFGTNTKELKRLFPKVRLVTGGLDQHTLQTADMVVVSPGVSIQALGLSNKIGPNTHLLGDIELFAHQAKAPIIAITGSNGKSTVATLVDLLLTAGGKKSLLGGNIGVPALDLLDEAVPDVYVLELSSFQLETTYSLAADVAVVLNLSEDHLDRYPDYQAYVNAKMRVYRNARREVIYRDDPNAPQITLSSSMSFGINEPTNDNEFGVIQLEEALYLAHGNTKLLNVEKLLLKGQQNWLNVLASFALVSQFGLGINKAMLKAVCDFEGLIDRCEQIAKKDGVLWVNDSKGTNVGATIAAIKGFSQTKLLIMGGQSKNADLSALNQAIDDSVREVVLIGEDAEKIKAVLNVSVKSTFAETLEQAVMRTLEISQPGDVVLMSPACASYDMFENYAARGEAFRQLVKKHVLNEALK